MDDNYMMSWFQQIVFALEIVVELKKQIHKCSQRNPGGRLLAGFR